MASLNTVGEVIDYLLRNGWHLAEHRHDGTRVLKHPKQPGKVTISGQDADPIGPRSRDSVLRQAGGLAS